MHDTLAEMSELPSIGELVRSARKRKRWTQSQLAESIDVSVKTISAIERGIQGPSWDTLVKLAEALGVEIHLVDPEDKLVRLASNLYPEETEIIVAMSETLLATLRKSTRMPGPDNAP